MADATRIAEELRPVVEGLGLELYDVEVTGAGRALVLRVLVDREGGIDLDSVSAATQQVSAALDGASSADGLPAGYALEVSSPGVERPLRRPEHFRRAVGATATVKFRAADGATSRVQGRVVGATDDELELDVDGDVQRVRYEDLLAARTIFEWGPAPKPGKGAGKKEVAAR